MVEHAAVYCHIAPPCGTCSAARKIQRHPSDPPVLRNEAFPMGLPGLKPLDQQRVDVDAANAIYLGMVDFIHFLDERKVLWSVENPGNSMLWSLPCMQKVRQLGTMVQFDACCFGGERKTLKGFLSNIPAFRRLAVRCNGGHPHKPWGRVYRPDGSSYFATKDEAAYPRPLCMQIVHLICV